MIRLVGHMVFLPFLIKNIGQLLKDDIMWLLNEFAEGEVDIARSMC